MIVEKAGENGFKDGGTTTKGNLSDPATSTSKDSGLNNSFESTNPVEVTVDVTAVGNGSDSGASLSPDSITEEYRNRSETLSDEEINELYLGNVSAKNRRRRGIFGGPGIPQPILQEDTSEYGGSGGSPTTTENAAPNSPERKVSAVSFDLDTPEDYSHLRRKKGILTNSSKRITFGGFEEDANDQQKSEHGRRWSRVSFESNGSSDTCSKSETSVSSTPQNLASRVRRDSIALALNGIPLIAQPSRKDTIIKKIQKINLKDTAICKKYYLHVFVLLIFILSLVFVCLAWYYHNETESAIVSSQQIFFNPRSRILTLSDPQDYDVIHAKLGQDIPFWQLPLNCPLVETGDQSKKECKWKKRATLRIQFFHSSQKDIQCYNVSWESLNPKYVPYDCFDLGDSDWFGSSNLTSDSLPISGSFDFNSNKYKSDNDGVLQSAAEYYWVSSNGVAILVNSDIPIHINWNTTRNGQMCLISNFTIPFYDQGDTNRLPHLNYTVCNGHDMLTTHLFMRKLHSDPEGTRLVDSKMLRYPHWSTVAEKKSRDVHQTDVENIAKDITKHGFNCSTVQVDGIWQSSYGDFKFSPDNFPNTTQMLELVSASNCSLLLDVNPYFHFSSPNYNNGVRNGYFVKDSGNMVPGLVHWQHGIASVLDVSSSDARAWFTSKIQSLTLDYNIKSLRFSYGSDDWLPHRPHFSKSNETPHKIRKLFTEMMSTLNQQLVVDRTSQSQHVTTLVSVKASVSSKTTKACISDIVSKSLTLGILGYPFLISDGFRSYHDETKESPAKLPSKDLFIRWLEISAFFPAMSYSLTPWSYDEETVKIAKQLNELHMDLVMPIITSDSMKQELKQGFPILRPLWMTDSSDTVARQIRDQFLVGHKLLVAPILCEGITKRDIYIPRGIWNDQIHSTLVVGPKWLLNYRVELNEIPHFLFMRVYE